MDTFCVLFPSGSSKWTPPPESTSEVKQFVDKDHSQACIRLFNLKKDPIERFDVAASHPNVVRRLLGRLAELQATAVPAIDHSVTVEYQYNRIATPTSQPPMPHPLVHLSGLWAPWMD